MAFRLASVTEGQVFSLKEAYWIEISRFTLFDLFRSRDLSCVFMRAKGIARRDFHFLLCAFVAEIKQILDRLIIQLVCYILKQ